MDVVVVAHAVATLFLAGLIWTIQVVHYPLFAHVGDGFVAFHTRHSTRIAWLTAVPWAVQGVTTAALLLWHPTGVDRWLVWLTAGAAAVTVAVTVVLSIPRHEALGHGFDATAHRALVVTNWLRTAAWSVGGAAAVAILWQYRGGAG